MVVGDDAEATTRCGVCERRGTGRGHCVVASCASHENYLRRPFGPQSLIDSKTPPAIISMSFSECEAALGAAGNATYRHAYQQAVAEGISVFVSTGDEGAASCDANQPAARNLASR